MFCEEPYGLIPGVSERLDLSRISEGLILVEGKSTGEVGLCK
jgi:hypothetical protein